MKSVFLSPLEKASVVAFQVVGGGVALDSCLCKALFSHPYLPPASPLLRVGVILCPLLPPPPRPGLRLWPQPGELSFSASEEEQGLRGRGMAEAGPQ